MSERHRPKLHFSPAKGWMNDPNGLIKVGGWYHMYFQYDPDSISHGPMHWGHARSTDLVTWEELPVALYPTELGTCFSGSAVETVYGEVKLFYTAHRRVNGEDYQVQCLVHADPTLTTYRLDERNPVLGNPGLVCFRDPKVLWHEPSGRWIMAVTHGQSIGFYSSEDMNSWTFQSSFGEGHGRHSDGPWECPHLFSMADEHGSEHWILLVGIGSGAYAEGSGTQYFIGHFDGATFTNGNAPGTTLWLDHGRDFYAAQSFFDRSGSVPMVLGWASNWQYARNTPTESFRGSMSLPRALSLVDTKEGARLSQTLPASVLSAFEGAADPSTFRKDIEMVLAVGGSATITLFAECKPQFVVTRISPDTVSIAVERPQNTEMPAFGHTYKVFGRYSDNGPLRLQVCVDNGLVEFATSDGLIWITQLFFPAKSGETVILKQE